MRKFFLTVGFSGLSPKAPGTVGSFVSLILGMLLLEVLPLSTIFMLTLLITVIAVKQINLYEKDVGEHDSKEIVVDELAGMWLTMIIGGVTAGAWMIAAVAFVYFRIFDIWKPSIIGRIDEKVPGGWGVMGDDILAGLFAGICTAFTYNLLF
jgi:phosphatidylglycerophosphatase A